MKNRSFNPGIRDIQAGDVNKAPYISYVARCLDLLMEHGTDRYGPVHTPILASILDLRCFESPQRPEPFMEYYRVNRRQRRNLGGANMLMDQPTLKALYLLADISGNDRYKLFADNYIDYYVNNIVDENGLFWWGWHRSYNIFLDEMVLCDGGYHEIHGVHDIDWEHIWQVNPEAARRCIEAVWKWHVIDKSTGMMDRHDSADALDDYMGIANAGWMRGMLFSGYCDMAMACGTHLHAFAFLYSKTQEGVWLERAKLLAGYHWNSRNKETNLCQSQPSKNENPDSRRCYSIIPGLHAHALLKAWQRTGDETFKEYAVGYLEAFDKYAYDEDSGKYWGMLFLDGTPDKRTSRNVEYCRREGMDPRQPMGHLDLWSPYVLHQEYPQHTAQNYVFAYQLTGNKTFLDSAKKWAAWIENEISDMKPVLDSWYREYVEKFAPYGTYAEHYARTISFFNHMYVTTGNSHYLDVARKTVDEAVSALLFRGVFRGHPAKPYYEATDGVGYFLVSLIQLDRILANNDTVIEDKVMTMRNGATVGFDNW